MWVKVKDWCVFSKLMSKLWEIDDLRINSKWDDEDNIKNSMKNMF